jgi:hypothetical protein
VRSKAGTCSFQDHVLPRRSTDFSFHSSHLIQPGGCPRLNRFVLAQYSGDFGVRRCVRKLTLVAFRRWLRFIDRPSFRLKRSCSRRPLLTISILLDMDNILVVSIEHECVRCYYVLRNSRSDNTRWCYCVFVSSSANFYETDSNSSHFVNCQSGRQRHESSFQILSCPRCGEYRKRNLTISCEPMNYVRAEPTKRLVK